MAKRTQNSQKSGNTSGNTLVVKLCSGREGWLLVIFIAIALAVCGRLFMLTVLDAEALASEGQQKRSTEYTLTAQRGKIIDRNGNILASSVEATTIYVNPAEIYADPKNVQDVQETAAILSKILGGTEQQYLEALTADKNSSFVYLAKKADTAVAEKLKAANQEFSDQEIEKLRAAGEDLPPVIKTPLYGVHYLPDSKRHYPYGAIGAQIIGSVDDQNIGVSGLEQTYDSILRGVDGKMTLERGKALEQGQQTLPMIGGVDEQVLAVDGQDIIVSVDIELQDFVEANLKAMAEKRNTKNANTMVLDGATGEIYAAASIPLYDRAKVTTEEVQAGATTLKSITEPYEPGSILKAYIAGLALENKTMSPDDTIYCPSRLEIYDYDIKDAWAREDQVMSLREIIAHSSNVGVSLMEQNMGNEAYGNFLFNGGLGMPTHVDYPGETHGDLAEIKDWTPVQAANISFGQGVQVSAIQVASFYGAIANDGVMVQPHFLLARPQYDSPPEYQTKRVLAATTARELEDLLRGVVTEGTGQAAGMDGFDVVGKTGTAEKASKDGGYLKDEWVLSFVGYIDNSTSKLVCTSSFDNPVGEPAIDFFPIVMNFVANRYMIAPQPEPEPVNTETPAKSSGEESSGAAEPSTEQAPKSAILESQEKDTWNLDTSG